MNLARRLRALEAKVSARTRKADLTDADWRRYAAHKAAMLVHILGPAEGDCFERLYAAIAAGNRESDECQSWRAGLKWRFDWASSQATISMLGLARPNDWIEVPVPDDVRAELVKAFNPALAERHPDIVFPDHWPTRSSDDWASADAGQVIWRGERVTGPLLSAFAPHAFKSERAS